MAGRASPEFVDAFVSTLPDRYRKKYDARDVVAHANVAAARGEDLVATGLFGATGAGLCVVARDRPGLLSLISAALVTSALDVTAAEVYTRAGQHGLEAVDLFWVVRTDTPEGPLTPDDATRVRDAVTRLLRGEAEAARSEVEQRLATRAAERSTSADATVRFLEDGAGGLTTLEVETSDRSGLLFSLASALFRERVQIVESEVRTTDERVLDRFRLVEIDGSPITSSRRLEIQVAVLNAIEPARRSVPPPKNH